MFVQGVNLWASGISSPIKQSSESVSDGRAHTSSFVKPNLARTFAPWWVRSADDGEGGQLIF